MSTRSEADASSALFMVRRATRASLSMPRHVLNERMSITYSSRRTVIHLAAHKEHPHGVVGDIYGNGAKSHVHHHVISTVAL